MKKILLTAAAVTLGVAMTTATYADCGSCCKKKGCDGDKKTTDSTEVQQSK